METHTHAHGHGAAAHDFDWASMVAFAEREAEVLAGFLGEATAALAELCSRDGLAVERILDIGSGPGVGTCALATTFPSARVLAADGSAEMLANVVARAERLGLAERVTTCQLELPDGLDGLGRADLVWASMVLHHVGDEEATLRGLRERLDSGGVLGLAEFGDPIRFLPEAEDLGRPGIWGRLDAARSAWLADMRAALPGATPSEDYPSMLEAAGFNLVVDRLMTADLLPPLDDRARQVARDHLLRMREHVAAYAEAEDLAAIDALLDEHDPDGIMRRPDALVHASRRLLVARAT